ncbi:MAG TPA: glutamate--tRNA ligase, partial [Gemmatimonadales bacterium]|nr:glutamate--tRNA ligase [Gemmatimonadales bacterium]
AAGEAFTVRLRMEDTELAWDDAVHGRISFQGHDLDDFVILRTDGTPIYNLAVVSDDIAMRITHVIRGDDHVSNTPKQIALYRALGAPEPVLAHVPMILGSDGKKLSKRHGATAVGDYQDQGIFPAAMRNFLALLGWSPGGDREIMPEDEMIALFSLEGIQSKPAVFDVAKLEWMNGQYLSATPAEELRAPVERQLARQGVSAGARDLLPIIDAVKTRSRTVVQLAEQVAVRLNGPSGELEPKAAAFRQKLGPAFEQNLARAVEALSPIGEGEWNSERILEAIKQSAEQHGTKLGDAMQPIRIALTGGTVSEPVNDLLAVIGRDAALERLKRVVRHTS